MIRQATEYDIPELVKLGREFVETCTDYTYNKSSVAETLRAVINGAGVIFISENGARLTGTIGLLSFPLYISGEKVASELFWWVKPKYRKGSAGLKLLIAAERWAEEEGCKRIAMISLERSMPERTSALYVRRGYDKTETTYSKEI